MISLSKKSFNTLFNTISTDLSPPGEESSANHHPITPLPITDCGSGLKFLTTSGKLPKYNNVIVSPSLINSPVKVDQIESGLEVLNSGDVDRLASCTEHLRLESCHEKCFNNDFKNTEKSRAVEILRKSDTKNKLTKNKLFPPPLSSLDENGKPTFFLRPVRENGRLKLIQVKINRPERRLHAVRQDGRLRLYLAESDQENGNVITSTDVVGEKLTDNKEKRIENEFKFPVSRGYGEDCQLLHEKAKNYQQHQHNMHGWGQQCDCIR